jgi:hypothetical protein
VALVQHVAGAVGDLPSVPAPEDLLLREDGSLSSGFASETAEHPVTSLAKLLMAGLEGIDAPPQLCSLAADNATASPALPTVASFSRALSFYERPDRAGDIQAILTRLSTAKAEAAAEHELERLRERIAHADPDEKSEKSNGQVEPESPARKPLIRRRFPVSQSLVAAAIIVLVVGALVVVGFTRGRLALSAAADSLVSAAGVGSADTAAPSSLPHQSQTESQKDAPGAHKSTAAHRPESPGVKGTTQHSTASLSRAVLRPPVQVDVADRTPQILPLPAFSWTDAHPPEIAWVDSHRSEIAVALREPLAGHVYSAGESDVTPARLTRAQLPQEPSPNSETGYFDMVIDERGEVESVKLLSPTRRYQDRMLVAAAKAWKFTPALLNGTPVKYRLQIPIILHDVAR